ncbi:glycosyltransferase family 2 protein [Polaribacter sp. Z014]|uniref:glycosyltransferase family 2 protein n=1 Tax=Polaribacter sp. Z014 TaxID=2927126 RepID=UPI00201FBCD0|nr:glycosyltransferase family 2 protein [Polaribacter sp. Z014]MCL7764551.1 glycosyltransferase family 2 protein [Polaribacter sp. Z014]
MVDKEIAVLLTCHNRKDKTIACLKALYKNEVPNGYTFTVFLVDDGSIDGTEEAVKAKFPKITIIKGNGNLFWNQGMRLAWESAVKVKDYDFYLWLNDDTILNNLALNILESSSLLKQNKAIIVGSTSSFKDDNEITYGGRSLIDGLITPLKEAIACDYFNGNIVWIPKEVYKKAGINDSGFQHALGDFDYGLRAGKLGFKMYIAPGFLGKCDSHENLATWCNPKKTFNQRWKAFRSPLGNNPEEFFIFEKRHKGFTNAIFHYLTNHLRVIYPSLWSKRVIR